MLTLEKCKELEKAGFPFDPQELWALSENADPSISFEKIWEQLPGFIFLENKIFYFLEMQKSAIGYLGTNDKWLKVVPTFPPTKAGEKLPKHNITEAAANLWLLLKKNKD